VDLILSMNVRVVKAVIFDLDGLLMDTEPIYAEANQIICTRFGKIYSTEVQHKVIGKAEILGATVIVESLSLPMDPKEYLKERDQILESLFPNAKLMPGGERLTTHLHESGIPIAVATSSNKHSVELKSKNHSLWFQNVFGSKVITGDDPNIKKGKPAPDIFIHAAQHLKIGTFLSYESDNRSWKSCRYDSGQCSR